MNEFPKIQTMFKRDMEKGSPHYGRLLIPHWSKEEFEYLAFLKWTWTEKFDGMNIRVKWPWGCDFMEGMDVGPRFGGKTDRAELPGELLEYLAETFIRDKMYQAFSESNNVDVCLYGEGYGPGIQKGGKYRDDKGFILFDVKVGHWWLKRDALKEIALAFEIPLVPIVTECDLMTAMFLTKIGMYSSCIKSVGEPFFMEGLVGQPKVPLFCRNGSRVITKIKHADFKGEDLTDEERATFAGSHYNLWPERSKDEPGVELGLGIYE